MKKKIAVIGGGAAGMFAALNAAERGCEVHLFEKNEKLGKKIYITGKGTVFFRYQIILQMLLMHFAGKCGNIKCRCI